MRRGIKMGIKANLRHFVLGWYPQGLKVPNNHLNIEDQKVAKFQFNKRFWVSLAISYSLFVLLVVVPFLLGYIDASIVGYGLTGIGWSLACMAIVYAINQRPELRKSAGYVAVGVWLGFAVFVLFALVLFPRQFLAAGSGAIVLLITVAPATGGVIGYFAGKKASHIASVS
jgi:hypothetical protein